MADVNFACPVRVRSLWKPSGQLAAGCKVKRVTHDDESAQETVALTHAGLDGRYLEFFNRFNQQRFFEAHEVLEDLWLPQRLARDGAFYKGLIQLAGAFVHAQKGRNKPAQALLRLAQGNLSRYPTPYRQLDTATVLGLIGRWMERIELGAWDSGWPRLDLLPRSRSRYPLAEDDGLG